MNEYMLMMARSRTNELTQEAAQVQRAARAKTKTPRVAAAQRPRRSASWLAMAVARLRPTVAGR